MRDRGAPQEIVYRHQERLMMAMFKGQRNSDGGGRMDQLINQSVSQSAAILPGIYILIQYNLYMRVGGGGIASIKDS